MKSLVAACVLLSLLSSAPAFCAPKLHPRLQVPPPPLAYNWDCIPPDYMPESSRDVDDMDVIARDIQSNPQYIQDANGLPSPAKPAPYVASAWGDETPTQVNSRIPKPVIFNFWGHGWGNPVYGHGGGMKCKDGWLVVKRCSIPTCRCQDAVLLDALAIQQSKCRLAVLGGCYTATPTDSAGIPYDPHHTADDHRHGNLTRYFYNLGVETVLGFDGETSSLEPAVVWRRSFWQSLCQPVAAGFTDGIPRTVKVSAEHATQAVIDYLDETTPEGDPDSGGYATFKICGNQNLRIIPVLKSRGTN